jgi:hypothetical protein
MGRADNGDEYGDCGGDNNDGKDDVKYKIGSVAKV